MLPIPMLNVGRRIHGEQWLTFRLARVNLRDLASSCQRLQPTMTVTLPINRMRIDRQPGVVLPAMEMTQSSERNSTA